MIIFRRPGGLYDLGVECCVRRAARGLRMVELFCEVASAETGLLQILAVKS